MAHKLVELPEYTEPLHGEVVLPIARILQGPLVQMLGKIPMDKLLEYITTEVRKESLVVELHESGGLVISSNTWTPVTDSLPESYPDEDDYREYNVTCVKPGRTIVTNLSWQEPGWYCDKGICWDKYVVAWQPVPEAYVCTSS